MNFELEGQVRAFWIDTETTLGIQLPVAHAALTWVTRHAAWVITRSLVKSDAATAYKRLYGKEFHGEVMQLFEQLWYKEPSRSGAKLEPRWLPALWLGKSEKSDEHLLLAETDVVRAPAVTRIPEERRWVLE